MRLYPKTWREDLARYKIVILEESEVIKKARSSGVLSVTNCSRTKGELSDKKVPKEFYVSSLNLRFYRWCEKIKVPYGVLSDMYGLHLWNEEKEYYDVHPSKLNSFQFRKLGSLIYYKMESIKCNQLLYYGLPPVTCTPYFRMMIVAGFPIFYTTKLPKE